MNSQRGKASTKASSQRQTQKSHPNVQDKAQKSKPRQRKQPRQRQEPQVGAAAAYARGQLTGQAQVLRTSVDSCRIRHRELVSSLTGSVGFVTQLSLAMNPGISGTFPWLSIEAQGWEKYRFERLHVCAYTRTGTSTPGSIIMSPDYDAADAAPVSEQVSSAYFGTVEDAPWKDIKLLLDPARLRGDRFIRTGGLAANLDIKTYDVANVFVSTTDGTAVSWSKVWVEYDVILMNPQLPPGGPVGTGTLFGGGGSLAAATPFGAAPTSSGSYALMGAGTNVLSMSGLSIGTEYSLSVVVIGTVITVVSAGTEVGLTVLGIGDTSMLAANATYGSLFFTFSATATSASCVITVAATTVTLSKVVWSALTAAPGF